MKVDWSNPELQQLATNWFEEIRSDIKPDNLEESFGSYVTDLSFFASAEMQWEFLKITSDMAENKHEFGYVAAFVFEQLMSTHGRQYIDEVEKRAAENQKFKAVVQRSWRHSIDRKTWKRLQKIQGIQTAFWKFW